LVIERHLLFLKTSSNHPLNNFSINYVDMPQTATHILTTNCYALNPPKPSKMFIDLIQKNKYYSFFDFYSPYDIQPICVDSGASPSWNDDVADGIN